MMKSSIPTLVAAAALAVAFAGCEVEKTDEGEAPDVDVEGGEAPEYDVNAPDVDVDMEEKTVTVPDVDVDMEKKRMKVPDVDINPADEQATDENPEAEEPPPDTR